MKDHMWLLQSFSNTYIQLSLEPSLCGKPRKLVLKVIIVGYWLWHIHADKIGFACGSQTNATELRGRSGTTCDIMSHYMKNGPQCTCRKWVYHIASIKNVGSRHLHEGSAYIVQPHASKLLDLQLVHKVVRSRYQSNPHCHFAHKIDKIIPC